MKQTLLFTLSFFTMITLMTACSTGQVADKMAVVGNPSLASDPCAALDNKVMRLDRFTEVVKNSSAFHLEEKANAIPTPGITVSNNRKQMLKDAERKYAEYAEERRKYGCKTPVPTDEIAAKMPILDSCAALDNKVMRLDRFTEVVKNSSAFHLEEKANAIPTPGITVSNNRKQMLKDAKRKYAEYEAERQKYSCETPEINDQTTDAMPVSGRAALPTGIVAATEKKAATTTMPTSTKVANTKESDAVLPVAENTPGTKQKEAVKTIEKKDTEISRARQKTNVEAPVAANTAQMDDKITASANAAFSFEKCKTLDEELIELSEFTTMVKNTSAFHLEEKASALPSPGFTVSNNKKKMLRDIEKRYAELLQERKKYGCEPL